MNSSSATKWLRGLAAGIALVAAAAPQAVQAQGGQTAQKLLIGFAGTVIKNGKSFSKSTAPWKIAEAPTYYYSITGQFTGTGALAGAVPKNTKFVDFLESVKPGSSEFLKGSFDGKSYTRKVVGSRQVPKVGKVKVSITLSADIDATGVVTFSIKNLNVTGPSGKIPGTVRLGTASQFRISTTPL